MIKTVNVYIEPAKAIRGTHMIRHTAFLKQRPTSDKCDSHVGRGFKTTCSPALPCTSRSKLWELGALCHVDKEGGTVGT